MYTVANDSPASAEAHLLMEAIQMQFGHNMDTSTTPPAEKAKQGRDWGITWEGKEVNIHYFISHFRQQIYPPCQKNTIPRTDLA